MANPEHVEILKQGVEVWNRWIFEKSIAPDLTGIVLQNANLQGMILRGAKLQESDLRESNVGGTNLQRANLKNSNLQGANLEGAILQKADLSGVDFASANLSLANLQGANLKKSWLFFTNFDGSRLYQTSFEESAVHNTIFTDVDLRSVEGLDTVLHHGPSRIGIETIYKSKGQIPEIFLRGCGVPENFIAYMNSFTMNPVEYYSCFISYSHKDKSFARRLHDQLQAKGIRCWLDEHQLLPGDDLHDMIDKGIRLWDKVLLCCSERALNSWWVDKELDRAIKKEERLWKERGEKVLTLIPLNLDGYMFDGWESGKKDMVTNRLAADFTGWETDNSKFEEQFERVVKALQTKGAREEAPASRL